MAGKIESAWHKKFANLVLSSACAFCVVGLVFTFYRSALYPWQALRLYSVLFISGVLLFGFALRWQENRKVNFALVVFSVGIMTYVAEIALVLVSSASMNLDERRAEAAQQRGIEFDTRTKFQVIMDLRHEGVEAYPEHRAVFLDSHGEGMVNENMYVLGTLAQKVIVHCNESGAYTVFQSDEHGFNNSIGLYEKQRLDALLLGDSFAEGSCVKPGEDIAGQLRKRGKLVINVATSGNGPLIELATLQEYAHVLKPEKVLWLYYEGNDLQDLAQEEKSSFLLQYLEDDFTQDLVRRQPEINQKLEYHIENLLRKELARQAQGWLNDFSLARILRLYESRKLLRRIFETSEEAPIGRFMEVLTEAKARVALWGGN